MTIKEILSNDTLLSDYIIEVNGEKYDKCKHDDLIHFHTEIETYEEYNHILNVAVWSSKIKFTAIERSKILQLLKSKDKDTDTSISDYMDKRINEISKE